MDKELLFVLIIILTLVINIIKAVKKKAAKQASAPEPPVTGRNGENIQEVLREMFGEREPTIVRETEQEAASLETLEPMGGSAESIDTYVFKEPEYSKSTISSEIFDVSPAVQPEQEDQIKSRKHLLKSGGMKTDFDLKSAVIYHAILDRPYS
jgi:hypothetical protein